MKSPTESVPSLTRGYAVLLPSIWLCPGIHHRSIRSGPKVFEYSLRPRQAVIASVQYNCS